MLIVLMCVVTKYADQQPLDRQAQFLGRHGVKIECSTALGSSPPLQNSRRS
jgi:hypothetical protein